MSVGDLLGNEQINKPKKAQLQTITTQKDKNNKPPETFNFLHNEDEFLLLFKSPSVLTVLPKPSLVSATCHLKLIFNWVTNKAELTQLRGLLFACLWGFFRSVLPGKSLGSRFFAEICQLV